MQQNYRFSRFPCIDASHAAGRVWREWNTFFLDREAFNHVMWTTACHTSNLSFVCLRVALSSQVYHLTPPNTIHQMKHSRKLLSRCRCSFFSAWNVTENPNNSLFSFSLHLNKKLCNLPSADCLQIEWVACSYDNYLLGLHTSWVCVGEKV